MSNIPDFISKRRSIRSYTGQMLAGEHFDTLLRAAMSAPSARCCDPWEFITVCDRETIDALAPLLPNSPFLPQCGGVIVVCGDIKKAYLESLSYLLQDCSAAIENILLAAPALGLGGCWLGVHPREERISALREFFHLPENIIPVGCCALGFPAAEVPACSRFDAAKIHNKRW